MLEADEALDANTAIGGMKVVCTGVTPMPPRPPQKALLPRRGEVGRSFWVLGVTIEELELLATALEVDAIGGEAGDGRSSAGGGRSGSPRPSSRHFLRAEISCRRAMFSDLEEPSSERIASMRRSRSAISPSRVVMYSLRRTRKFRALILLRSCLFSLLDIFLYSSGLGRQSSGSRILSGAGSFLDFVSLAVFSLSVVADVFLTPPERTVPLRDTFARAVDLADVEGGSSSLSSSSSRGACDVEE